MYFFKCFLCIFWNDCTFSPLHFLNEVYQIGLFVNFIPSLHLWNKSHLIIMYDLNVFLNLVQDFCICVHQGYWLVNFFSCGIWFSYQGNAHSIKLIWDHSHLFCFLARVWERLMFFEHLVEFTMEAVWFWTFDYWEVFDHWLTLCWFVQIFYFISWFNLCSLYAIGHYPLVLGCLICRHIVVHSILLGYLYLCIACNFSYFWFYSFMPFYFLDMSGLKVCQFYFIFSKNQLLISLIFSIAF